jgi:hypothetical protein
LNTSSINLQFDDDMDLEERERVLAAERANQERAHMLF